MGLVAGVIVLPLALHYASRPDEFWEPMSRVSVIPDVLAEMQVNPLTGLFPLILNLYKASMAFIAVPLTSFYSLQQPLLPPLWALGFVAGVVIVVIHSANDQNRFLVVWGLLIVGMNVVSTYPPAAHRYIIAAPLAVMVIALALSKIAEWVEKRWTIRLWGYGLVIGVVIIAASMDSLSYLSSMGPSANLYQEGEPDIDWNSVIAISMTKEIMTYPKDTQIVFFGAPLMWYHGFAQMQFLAPQVISYDVEAGGSTPALRRGSGQPTLFIFLPHRIDEMASVENQYPGGTFRRFFDKDGKWLLFVEYGIASP
ncbi:MAG: hypothetical protein ABSA10_01135 [Anaerolineales bacterium]|jgi:hypothetical protein